MNHPIDRHAISKKAKMIDCDGFLPWISKTWHSLVPDSNSLHGITPLYPLPNWIYIGNAREVNSGLFDYDRVVSSCIDLNNQKGYE